jgi:hypothetical protein
MNSKVSRRSCENELKAARKRGALRSYYDTYLPAGQEIYREFFDIPASAARSDIQWEAGATQTFTLPFVDPGIPAIRSFLQDNIEDEWHGATWRLLVRFDQDARNRTHVKFEPGALPHVNDVGGSEITMDANAPLTEYNVRWTIRHEFGHVLGFPDCYLEFYDTDREVMISYQLDLEDLMCSRTGHIKSRHYDELKRVYDHS